MKEEKMKEAKEAKEAAEPAVLKEQPKQYGQTHKFNCLHKLEPGEPFFVLRGKDLLASHLVEQWAAHAEKHGIDPAKVQEARQCALDMMAFPGRKYPD